MKRHSHRPFLSFGFALGTLAALLWTPMANAQNFSDWSTPVNLGATINSAFNDQHPAISKNGLSLYFVSDRPGGFGGFDIWVSQRASVDDPWGPPQNLGPIINSSNREFAPAFSPDRHSLYFSSNGPGGCGGSDLWVSHRRNKKNDFGWEPPVHLGCVLNSAADDDGPTFFEDDETGVVTLFFTSLRSGGLGDFDIYASTQNADESFGPAINVVELNSSSRDTRTAIRRDGLEMLFASNRPGGAGNIDLWVSIRASTLDPWSPPVNLGFVVNSSAVDGAPALSWDGTTLYFYSNRAGGSGASDLYVTTRTKLK